MNKDDELIIHNPNGLPLYEINSLVPLQGDYKILNKKDFEKMKKSFIKHGFSFPVKIWTDNKGINFIIGGHQRLKILKIFNSCIVVDYINTDGGLIETQRNKYNEIKIPCELVQAKNRIEAIKLLLLEDSRFGTTNNDSSFFKDEGLSIKDFDDFSIQDLNLDNILDVTGLDLDKHLEDELNKISDKDIHEETEKYKQDLTKPGAGEMLNQVAKMKHAIDVVNLTFTIPQDYAAKLEDKLSEVPLTIVGREREQNLRGRRLLKLLLDVEIRPL